MNLDSLQGIVSRAINRLGEQIEIDPANISQAVLSELDPEQVSPLLVRFAADLELRQIARAELRKRFDPDDPTESEQHEMWPNLQKRYPKAHDKNDAPKYVLLEHLREEDKTWNVRKLRKEGAAKLASADALEAWWEQMAHQLV